MNAPSSPDDDARFGVTATFAGHARNMAAYALRSGATAPRDILAHSASGGRYTARDLVLRIAAHRAHGTGDVLPEIVDPRAVALLATVLGAQALGPDDRHDAVVLFEWCVADGGRKALHRHERLLFTELLAEQGRAEELDEYIRELGVPEIARSQAQLLRANVLNPFRGPASAGRRPWFRLVAQTFAKDDLEPPRIGTGDGTPFEQITCSATAAAPHGPLVTVLVDADGGDPGTAVRSILAQTYQNLQVLAVTREPAPAGQPRTGPGADDDRLRYVDAPDAATRFEAFNVALSDHAAGAYVLLHGSDRWSHPRRIESQVAFLEEHPAEIACLSRELTATEHLVFTGSDDSAAFVHEAPSTLVLRTNAVATSGYWDAVDRDADTELAARIAAITGRAVPVVGDAPLSIRRRPTPGPRYPALPDDPGTRWYRQSFATWHADAAETGGMLDVPATPSTGERPFPAGHAMLHPRAATVPGLEVDVVYATELRYPGGNTTLTRNELNVLADAGLRVALLPLESPELKPERAPNTRTLAVANRRGVHVVTPETHVRTRLTIVRHPTVLQLAEPRATGVRTDSLVVIVNHPPYEKGLTGSVYDMSTVVHHAAALFGTTPVVAPESALIRRLLDGLVDPRLVAASDWSGVIPGVDATKAHRVVAPDRRPVIGRHSRDAFVKWPDLDELRAVYPVDGSRDVRVLGGADYAARRTGLPVDDVWTVYPFGSRPVDAFLDELDFWVYFHGPELYESFGMAIIEALAAGLVVVLPHYLRDRFGEAALYADPASVQELVDAVWGDPGRYAEQSRRAIEISAARYGADALLDTVREFGVPVPTPGPR
jgi:hypothetical protein